MSPLLFFALLIGIGVNSSGCVNNIKCLENERSLERNITFRSSCPIENGIYCSDGLHCCPKEQKCSPDGKCFSLTNEISFAFPLTFEENHLKKVPCPDGSMCIDGETCCELSSAHYACCPHPDAVCCSDHIHCCPKDHKCDLERGHCKKEIDQLTNIVCPDGSSECPKDFTCCKLQSEGYGCCPSPDAVCCNDHIHCCPRGTTCNIERQRCISEISIPWMRKRLSFERKQKLRKMIKEDEKNISLSLSQLNNSFKSDNDVICSDILKSICSSGESCCPLMNESSGCCPVENGICCADNIHCCPSNCQCDLNLGKCIDQFSQRKSMLKRKELEKKVSSKIESDMKSSSLSTVVCPDKNLCPDETTCCELSNNRYGCCPYKNGNCCSDRIHCCGNGYVCADGGDRCIRRFNSFSSSKRNLIKFNLKEDQLCPDEKSKCPKNSTCCPNKNGNEMNYSCCPYSKGVCCGSNGSICCPNNYQCNKEELSCELNDSIFEEKVIERIDSYQCYSSNIFCSMNETCCSTNGRSNDSFACCPYSNGQCCSDGKHCCPQDQLCHNQTGQCL